MQNSIIFSSVHKTFHAKRLGKCNMIRKMEFLERKQLYHSVSGKHFQLLTDCTGCCSGVGPRREPMWGHVYISGGVVSYEFFRAKFGANMIVIWKAPCC